MLKKVLQIFSLIIVMIALFYIYENVMGKDNLNLRKKINISNNTFVDSMDCTPYLR